MASPTGRVRDQVYLDPAIELAQTRKKGAATHGEYKTPQGKLVAVDLSVNGGRLEGVRVTGDFFLEPPEALPELNRALEGIPEESAEEELAALVEGSLPQGTEMIGFSPEAVARAAARALGRDV